MGGIKTLEYANRECGIISSELSTFFFHYSKDFFLSVLPFSFPFKSFLVCLG